MELMLDIETLDSAPTAVVLTIGVQVFDWTKTSGLAHTVYLDPEAQVAMGRTISPRTVKWWMGQSEAARAKAFGGDRATWACRCWPWGASCAKRGQMACGATVPTSTA